MQSIKTRVISDEVEELHPGNDSEIIWAKLEIKAVKPCIYHLFIILKLLMKKA